MYFMKVSKGYLDQFFFSIILSQKYLFNMK